MERIIINPPVPCPSRNREREKKKHIQICQRDAFVPVITLDRCRRVHHREVSKNLPKAHSQKPYLIRHNNGPVALVVYFFMKSW